MTSSPSTTEDLTHALAEYVNETIAAAFTAFSSKVDAGSTEELKKRSSDHVVCAVETLAKFDKHLGNLLRNPPLPDHHGKLGDKDFNLEEGQVVWLWKVTNDRDEPKWSRMEYESKHLSLDIGEEVYMLVHKPEKPRKGFVIANTIIVSPGFRKGIPVRLTAP